MERKTGQYDITNVTGEAVAAFVPFPLPPTEPSLEIDDTIKELLVQAEQKLAQLDLASNLVPSLDWFIYTYVRKEAVLSSQIEGTQATLMDLFVYESKETQDSKSDPDITEVCNYLDAIKFARAQLNNPKGLPLSMRLLNETHKRLMKGVRGSTKQPGEVRKSQNWIGGTRPGNAAFVPPPPQTLPKLLTEFEKYIHADDSLPQLIRIALLHVQFETIHPYLDGNGRIGRLLIALLLEHLGLLNAPLLYLSLYFKHNRNEYYRLLGNVRLQGDWESWVRFFLMGVVEIANEATSLATHLYALVTEDREKVLAEKTTTVFAMRLFELLPTHPVVTMPHVVKLLNTSKPTAFKAIATLEKLKILSENTGRKRDRTFGYKDYLGKLKFGTELRMYRITLHYVHDDFVIKKDVPANYANNAGYELFYESETEAQKYYTSVSRKLKGTPSLRSANLEKYDSQFNRWEQIETNEPWSESDRGVPTLHASDVVSDGLQSLRAILTKANL